MINSIIIGTGSAIPPKRVPNTAFLDRCFVDKEGRPIQKAPKEIIAKLEQISGIRERRYVGDDQDTADLAAIAAQRAIDDSGLENSEIDGLIVAHNFGNIPPGESQGHLVPNLAAIVKNRLGIKNHKCFAWDILFGCPGWVEGMIIAHQYIINGRAKNILVVGIEVISRVLDESDLDSMLFGDGAGATVLSGREVDESHKGILAHNTYSHCIEELDFLKMGATKNHLGEPMLSPKMNGKNVFKYGMTYLPILIEETLADASIDPKSVKKFLFHQANEKMIMKISHQLLEKYNIEGDIEDLVPFIVHETGNSSVATIPTMIDLIKHGKLDNHQIESGDLVVMTSVGAGMHCNCLVYRA